MISSIFTLAPLLALTTASISTFKWNDTIVSETRSLGEIHQAALAEGGLVTLWHGGGSRDQEDGLKQAFEARFPGMTLNVTVDGSKYMNTHINRQLANGNLFVDTTMLQTTQDYPIWKEAGVLMNYKPRGFDQVYNSLRDEDGAYYGYTVNAWTSIWNEDKLNGIAPPLRFDDFLRPEYKNRIALVYPNDDDAVLYTFDLLLREYGQEWWEALLAQNPLWVRGPAVTQRILEPNSTYIATFTSTIGLSPIAPLNFSLPAGGARFISWAQPAAIFRDAPHPEGAKLLVNYLLSEERQGLTTWPTRRDIAAPSGFPSIMEQPDTDVTKFQEWMADRESVELLRFWFESQLGTPQGPNTPWEKPLYA